MKQLRTLCLAGLITVSFAAVCHAEVTTKVPVKDYMPQVRKIFENAYLGSDGKKVELTFTED